MRESRRGAARSPAGLRASRDGGLRGLALRVGSAPIVVARITQARPHRVALAGVLAFSALLEFVNLSSNSWANQYYSAAVKSMLGSLHNFFFVSSDPGGLITVDKPPLGLWLQGASAAIFGFHPLSLLVPEALCAVADGRRRCTRSSPRGAAPGRASPRPARSPCSRRSSPRLATTTSTRC